MTTTTEHTDTLTALDNLLAAIESYNKALEGTLSQQAETFGHVEDNFYILNK